MIKIDPDLCKGCQICVNTCYKHVYSVSTEANKKGVFLPYPEHEEKCTNCGECELMCPDQAIFIDVAENWWKKEENEWSFNPNFSHKRLSK